MTYVSQLIQAFCEGLAGASAGTPVCDLSMWPEPSHNMVTESQGQVISES